MKKIIGFIIALLCFTNDITAQYSPYDNSNFEWGWDIRVQISNGINYGQLTRSEANRLFNRLKKIERKEYYFLSDGRYDSWEQREIWTDVQYLYRQVGFELNDFDRAYFGFNFQINTLPWWYRRGPYDFYRYDRRGYGSMYNGYYRRNYVPYNFPSRNYYGGRQNQYNGRNYPNSGFYRGKDSNGYRENDRKDSKNYSSHGKNHNSGRINGNGNSARNTRGSEKYATREKR